MKKRIKLLIIFLFATNVVIGLIITLTFDNSTSIVYIDSQKIFNEFNMSREMKSYGEKEIQKHQKSIDSLYVIINSGKKHSDDIVKMIVDQEAGLEQFSKEFANQESTKIWKRINDYAKEFSVNNEYDFLLMTKSGGILYGNPDNDVTGEFLYYINNQYEGAK